MRVNIIELLRLGNLSGPESSGEAYRKLIAQSGDLKNLLAESLTEEQKKLFSEINEIAVEMELENASESFNAGFKLGLHFGLESAEVETRF